MLKNAVLLSSFILFFSCSTPSTTDGSINTLEDEGKFVEYNNPPAEGFNQEDSDMLAMLLADKTMQAMGGRAAWDKVEYLSWNFLGRRDHLWNKTTGNIRIEVPSESLTILMNINSKEGIAFKAGIALNDSLGYFLQKGYEWWVNDSYWLIMPYKLKDTGVTLKYLREDTSYNGAIADVIRLSFRDVGVTPKNIYDVWIDAESKLVTQWAYYKDSTIDKPNFITPWEEYTKFGEILLSGSRGDYKLTNIKVLTEVPDNIFEDVETTLSLLN